MRKTALLLMLFLLVGCAGEKTLTVAGSSCMGKLMEALAEGYEAAGGEKISVQLGGTQTGLLALRDGVCDIASCSRELDEVERESLEVTAAAMDGIAVIVHPDTGVSNLDISELRAIYNRDIVSWGELGGEDIPIVPIGREEASGTREVFQAAIGLEEVKYAQEHCETGILRESVANTRGAVGYIAFDYLNSSVKAVAVNGVFPDFDTVSSGRYPITRVFYLCTRKSENQGRVRRFLSFIESGEGQKVIEKIGVVPLKREPVV